MNSLRWRDGFCTTTSTVDFQYARNLFFNVVCTPQKAKRKRSQSFPMLEPLQSTRVFNCLTRSDGRRQPTKRVSKRTSMHFTALAAVFAAANKTIHLFKANYKTRQELGNVARHTNFNKMGHKSRKVRREIRSISLPWNWCTGIDLRFSTESAGKGTYHVHHFPAKPPGTHQYPLYSIVEL